MALPPKRNLFFLHVQKTGGAALTGALSNRFAERDSLLLYYSPEPDLSDIDSFRYVSGHVPISFADRFRDPPFLFTFLRDPVERALSAYSFMRTRPPGFASQILLFGRGPEAYDRARECMRLAREYTIEEFIEHAPDIAAEYLGNRQARALGNFSPEGGSEQLDDALAGLERCDFVGLTERLNESTLWLTRRLGWEELTPLPQINVTSVRQRRDQVSRAGMDALHELTSVDRTLYRHGVERFERQFAEREGARKRQDDTAELPDAPAVADLRFDQPIQGGGWVGRERIGGAPCICWMGHTKTAWVELAPERGADSLTVEIAHALHQSILESLRISIDGTTIPHTLAESDGAVVATAPLTQRFGGGRTVRVVLQVDRTIRPCDVDPTSPDDRQLSIAVRRIALRRS